ncbi:MAG TPA: aminotransferase class IV [Solirubrobacterales bacterium]|nr:aminotransferase class IV [Solirubrobacterales bacterium]
MTPARKPDPSQGIFETMLVVDGAPVAPEAHLSRLEASLEAVYGASLPAEARHLVAESAEGLELGRARLTFLPSGEIEVESGEIDRSLHFPAHPISLRLHEVSGGLGCHKWADRAAIPPSAKDEAVLVVDGDEVLEADRANVFAVRRGTVFTPPLDGRILPGVTRATTIELARSEGIEVAEMPLTLAELRQAEEVFLTNSIRGIEAVGSVDGALLADEAPFTRRLVAALRSGWKREAAARRRPLRTAR